MKSAVYYILCLENDLPCPHRAEHADIFDLFPGDAQGIAVQENQVSRFPSLNAPVPVFLKPAVCGLIRLAVDCGADIDPLGRIGMVDGAVDGKERITGRDRRVRTEADMDPRADQAADPVSLKSSFFPEVLDIGVMRPEMVEGGLN